MDKVYPCSSRGAWTIAWPQESIPKVGGTTLKYKLVRIHADQGTFCENDLTGHDPRANVGPSPSGTAWDVRQLGLGSFRVTQFARVTQIRKRQTSRLFVHPVCGGPALREGRCSFSRKLWLKSGMTAPLFAWEQEWPRQYRANAKKCVGLCMFYMRIAVNGQLLFTWSPHCQCLAACSTYKDRCLSTHTWRNPFAKIAAGIRNVPSLG